MISKSMKDSIILSFSSAEVFINTSDNIHFEIIIIDDKFVNVTLVDRHKCIYNIIGYYIVNKIVHAVSIKIYTLYEWNNFLRKK